MKDNIDRILDALEHPEQLSDKELDNLLDEPATRNLYNLISKTADALFEAKEPDIDAEWQKFAKRIPTPVDTPHKPWRISIFGRNAAAAIIFVAASLAMAGAAIGIKYALDNSNGQIENSNDVHAPTVSEANEPIKNAIATTGNKNESPEVIIFKDKPLVQILSSIAKYYGVTVKFNNPSKETLHLYFQWDQSLPLADVVEQLNNFEQIAITLTSSGLTIE
ncbi:MAG: DUF4974 domain-containing protein [Bacteroidales bacterium]|nr:DUF4974 domain-containing protein [Bacteroidales bacterium]